MNMGLLNIRNYRNKVLNFIYVYKDNSIGFILDRCEDETIYNDRSEVKC